MKSTGWVLVCSLLLLGGCASQDDVLNLDSRLVSMRDEQAALQQRINELESANKKAMASSGQLMNKMEAYGQGRMAEDQQLRQQSAELRILIQELRENERTLKGQLEESEFILKQKMEMLIDKSQNIASSIERLQKAEGELRDRILRIEQYLNFEPRETAQPSKNTPTTQKAEKSDAALSEDALYQKAKDAFDRGDLETALNGFQQMLKLYPNSTNADNAQFWIGEIYYKEKWYEKAILEYQKVIEKYPKGNKVQAALLKQGFSFYQLGDKANGRLILQELTKKYPNSNEAKIARKRIQEQ